MSKCGSDYPIRIPVSAVFPVDYEMTKRMAEARARLPRDNMKRLFGKTEAPKLTVVRS